MILAVDAGNSRIKWGVHDGRAWLAQDAVGHDGLSRTAAALRGFSDIRQAVISNVAGAGVAAALQAMLDEAGIAAHWVRAVPRACGVGNGYGTPAQLGSDRWAALVAAWHRRQGACIVACAGTALTVDALSSHGEFLGGLIVPGLSLMKTALDGNTAGLADMKEGRLCVFPSITGDAVYSGALQAMAGAVDRLYQELARREAGAPALLLAGGDAVTLRPALSHSCEIVDNLVLEGLVLLAREISS